MSKRSRPGPGEFCWVEVASSNAARARTYYAELFGWEYEETTIEGLGAYTLCQAQGRPVGGLYELPPQLLEWGLAPHWLPYVSVADLDQSLERVQAAGGSIAQAAVDCGELCRTAILRDPSGAALGLWQPRELAGIDSTVTSERSCWYELATSDLDRAAAFYTALFGWTLHASKPGGERQIELRSPASAAPMGGMLELGREHQGTGPHWLIYFLTRDCERLRTAGGNLLLEPTELPAIGRFSLGRDPLGARLALVEPVVPEVRGAKPKPPRKTGNRRKAKARKTSPARKKKSGRP